MPIQCEEPHCLQSVPDHLFQSHQDQHVAERIAAEEYEQHRQTRTVDLAVAKELGNDDITAPYDVEAEDPDYQMALALNREFRQEEEQRFFRQVQV